MGIEPEAFKTMIMVQAEDIWVMNHTFSVEEVYKMRAQGGMKLGCVPNPAASIAPLPGTEYPLVPIID